MFAALIPLLAGMFLTLVASIVGRVLLALFVGFVTYEGFAVGIDWLHNQIIANFAAMDSDILHFLGWLWVDRAIGLLFSAYAAALLIKLAGGTSLTKMVTKK